MNIQELRAYIQNNIDIHSVISQYINLSKKGNNYLGICPFHDDSKPSLSVSTNRKIFKCFACNQAGDVIQFLIKYHNWSFNEVINFLNATYNLQLNTNLVLKETQIYTEVEKQALSALSNASKIYFLYLYHNKDEKIKKYLQKRRISEDIIQTFNIGFAPAEGIKEKLYNLGFEHSLLVNYSLINNLDNDFFTNRLTFAISNEKGDIVAFSGRSLENENPKYLNSASSSLFSKSNILYNYHRAKEFEGPNKEIIITEGFMDTIAFYRDGIYNVVALMGTSLTENHINLLKNKQVTLVLDVDDAGNNATLKSIQILLKNKITTFVISWEDKMDPDEYFAKYGKQSLQKAIRNKKSALDFVYNFFLKSVNKNSSQHLENFVKNIKWYLEKSSLAAREIFLKKIETDLNIPSSAFQFKDDYLKQNFFNSDDYNFDPGYELEKHYYIPPSNHRKVESKGSFNFPPVTPLFFELKILLVVLLDQKFISVLKRSDYKFIDAKNKNYFESIEKIHQQPEAHAKMIMDTREQLLKMIGKEFYDYWNLDITPVTLEEFADWIDYANLNKKNHDINNKIKRINETTDPKEQEELLLKIFKN
ncbi:DNA primase [Mesomycoplasma conjunctivae]|uniref:DNA primase n=1 Tax=Mesomycoplasma conjunctivae TaxID=45361 RepID=UPI003DA69ED5